jgi:uncharacterized protein YodC (DUF2158 family)
MRNIVEIHDEQKRLVKLVERNQYKLGNIEKTLARMLGKEEDEGAFLEGDPVRHKSGGPAMVITRSDQRAATFDHHEYLTKDVYCRYWDVREEKFKVAQFYLHELQHMEPKQS